MSRAILLVALLGTLGACRTRTCAPGTILVEVMRAGAAAMADQIGVDVSVDGASPLHDVVAVKPGATDGTFQIDFAGKYPAGQSVTITLSALTGGTLVATTSAPPLTLGNGCEKLALTFADTTDAGTDASCVPTTTACGADVCGQITDECGGTVVCATPCGMAAVVPRLVNAGDTVMLEGTFSGMTTATLPGGVTADVTLLGPHRGRLSVPAGVTSGPLSVHTGNTDLDAGDLRRAAFALGMQPWSTVYSQAGGGRETPTLMSARQGHAVIANRLRVYVFGGRASGSGAVYKTVERLRINADSTLSSSTSAGTMSNARTGLQVFGTQTHLYAIGGFDGAVALKSIESTTINSDGTLDTFTNETVALNTAREGFSTTVVGNWVYAIGGTNGSGVYLDSIERAPVNADGTLGAFEVVSGKLTTARSQHHAFATQKSLFVASGVGTGGSPVQTIEEAPIMGDGSIGAFAPSATSLPVGIGGEVTGTRWGSHIYLRTPTAGYLATVASDGTVGNFTDTGLAPPMTLGGSRVVVARDTLYDLGGAGATGAVATIARAGLQFGAQLGTFATNSIALPTGVAQSGTMVFGDTLYLFGGADNTGAPPSTATTIYKALISPDDTLGVFSAALVPLPAALSEVAVAYAEKFVYFLGGFDGVGPTGAVYQLGVGSDGSLITPVPNPPPPIATLTTPRRAARAVVLDGQLCVLGGTVAAGPTTSVECAVINPSGTLGTFAAVTDNASAAVLLSSARSAPAVALFNGLVAVVGGTGPANDFGTAETGAVGTMAGKPIGTNFAARAGVTLPSARTQAAPLIVGNQFFLIGGSGGGTLSTHDVAGDTVSFNTAFGANGDLVAKRRGATAVVVGNQAYVLGGAIDTPTVNVTTPSIESAPLQ